MRKGERRLMGNEWMIRFHSLNIIKQNFMKRGKITRKTTSTGRRRKMRFTIIKIQCLVILNACASYKNSNKSSVRWIENTCGVSVSRRSIALKIPPVSSRSPVCTVHFSNLLDLERAWKYGNGIHGDQRCVDLKISKIPELGTLPIFSRKLRS